MRATIDLFFSEVNVFFPLLHRPTFERDLASGLQERDHYFGATVILVCCVGSQYSDDPRVLLDGSDDPHSSGWKWFTQLQMTRRSLLEPPSVYDLQFYSVGLSVLALFYVLILV